MATQTASSNKSPEREAPGGFRNFGLEFDWQEHAMTAVATVLALMVVVAVAVLLGMA